MIFAKELVKSIVKNSETNRPKSRNLSILKRFNKPEKNEKPLLKKIHDANDHK